MYIFTQTPKKNKINTVKITLQNLWFSFIFITKINYFKFTFQVI